MRAQHGRVDARGDEEPRNVVNKPCAAKAYSIEGSERTEVEDDELFPVGIVYEGYPGTHRVREGDVEPDDGSIFSERDIFIRALMLTPEFFDDWLERSGI